ncbi:MAG: EamA family transporter, partial [Chitinophagaceae bacterium]
IILFKGSTIPRLAVIGILLGFAGICIIFSDHLMDFLNPEFRIGILLSIISTISWAFGTLYTKSEAANFNPYFSLGLQMLISGTILFSISQATGQWISFSEIPSDSWLAIFYLVIVSSVITFIAYLYALQKLPTALASVYAYINPIVAVLLGAYFLGENLNIFIAIGGAVTLFGVYLVNNAFKKSKAAEPVQGSIE